MYQPAFPHIAWLITVAGFGAIIIGILLVRPARDFNWEPVQTEADRRFGVRLILGGVAVLLAYAGWRLI